MSTFAPSTKLPTPRPPRGESAHRISSATPEPAPRSPTTADKNRQPGGFDFADVAVAPSGGLGGDAGAPVIQRAPEWAKKAGRKIRRAGRAIKRAPGRVADAARRAIAHHQPPAEQHVVPLADDDEESSDDGLFSDQESVKRRYGRKYEDGEMDEEMARYVHAYERSRFTHAASPDIQKAIAREGLQTKYAGTGWADSPMGRGANISPEQVKGKVHLGLSRETKKGYGSKPLRVFLPRERTRYHQAKRVPPGGKAEDHKAKYPEELYNDPDQAGAVTSERDIGPQQIYNRSNRSLVQQARAHDERAANIFHAIQSQYVGEAPELPELVDLHESAYQDGYISDDYETDDDEF